jgi:membrane-associated PAP2 superfamily phosphatase
LTNSASATASSAKVEKLDTSEFREVDAHFTREEDDYRLEDAHDRVKKHTHTLEVILIQENPSCNNVNDILLLQTSTIHRQVSMPFDPAALKKLWKITSVNCPWELVESGVAGSLIR